MAFAPRNKIRSTKVVRRVPEILRLCRGKKVLHLGCSDMPYLRLRGEGLLHKQLEEVTGAGKLWGVDIDQEGVRLLRGMGFDNVLCGDCEALGDELKREGFEILLAGEIIEHVANPGLFLQSVAGVMTEKSELLLTTPNASSIKQFIHAMLRREKVHPDHNYYFSYMTIRQLLGKFGLHCDEIYYYQEVEGSGLLSAADRVLSLMTLISPVWSEGLVVRARLA